MFCLGGDIKTSPDGEREKREPPLKKLTCAVMTFVAGVHVATAATVESIMARRASGRGRGGGGDGSGSAAAGPGPDADVAAAVSALVAL